MHANVPVRNTNSEVLARIEALYAELIRHDGFGEIAVTVRILKRGQKEVLVRCGKEFRYIVDCES